MNCLSYIDALIVSAPDPGITPTPVGTSIVPGGTYEDGPNGMIVFSGTWTVYNNTGPSANNLHYTASAGSSASLSFYGTHVTLVYAGISGYGHADIFIDGSLVTRLNQSTAALTWQKAWTSPLLTPGYHTIRVAYVDGYYNVDAFIVRGLATATPTATAYTPSPTPSRTNTPVPPSTSTFTPTATNAPTATPTPLASEPAPQALTGAQYAYDGDGREAPPQRSGRGDHDARHGQRSDHVLPWPALKQGSQPGWNEDSEVLLCGDGDDLPRAARSTVQGSPCEH